MKDVKTLSSPVRGQIVTLKICQVMTFKGTVTEKGSVLIYKSNLSQEDGEAILLRKLYQLKIV